MAKEDSFLAAYKRLEAAIQQSEDLDSVLTAEPWVQKELGIDAKDKLYFARQIRNFITHHPDGADFLLSEKKRVDFLDSVTSAVQKNQDTVSKHLRKSGCWCVLSDKAAAVLLEMSKQKLPELPVLSEDKTPLDILSIYEIAELSATSKGCSIRKVVESRPTSPIHCVPPHILWKDALKTPGTILCTKDGTPKSKFMGVVKRA